MVDKKCTKKAPARRRGRKGEEKGLDKRTNENGATQHQHKQQQQSPLQHAGGTLLITLTDDAPTWFSCARQTPGRDDSLATHPSASNTSNSASLVAHYRAQADELYKRELQAFHHSKTKNTNKDEEWVENTMKRGTLKDRIAAMSVIVSTDPVHKLHALDGLLNMATNPNTRMAQMAAEALQDLFLQTLLPPNRKLLSLHQRPLHLYKSGKVTLSPRILLLWRYEEMLQEKYKLFLNGYLLQTLQNGLHVNKTFALRTASALLRGAPEGEAQLLSMLVNKLGDPSKKICAAAGHELRRVLEQHGNMQTIIAREVQQLAHRPHLSPRALYNCITFLNQLQLTASDNTTTTRSNSSSSSNKQQRTSSLPASLVKTYFLLFEVAVQKQKEEGSKSARLLSALLTGVNRAHPYLPQQDQDLEQHMDSLYRVVHTGPPSATTQALMLLFHVAIGSAPTCNPDNTTTINEKDNTTNKNKTQSVKMRQDRFYRALYATCGLPSVVASGKHLTMYFNLLYKAMKQDDNISRVNAMAKRLLCTTMHANPPVMAASLFLLYEISKTREELKSCLVDVAQGDAARAVLDSTKREPEAALVNANGESVGYAHLWETSLLAHSHHPSVRKFAVGEIQNYSGDPLRDFSLAPFLDKFSYRNPKTNNKNNKRGESIAERQRNDNTAKTQQLPVNDPSFLEQDHVNEQDEFFQTFFIERARRDEIKGVVRNKTVDENENDEEDEAFDIAENFTTGQTFGQEWETDSEEEAFVDSLAAKLIEDASGAERDLDDEDPDMEGWDDMYAEEEEGNDEDAFMDKMDDMSGDEESGYDESASDGEQQNDDDDDAFMDASDSGESDSDGEDPTFDGPGNEISDDDNEASEDDLALLTDSDSDETDSVSNTSSEKKKQRKTTRVDVGSETFADASEYEEVINNGWQQAKATKKSFVEDLEEETGTDVVPVQSLKHSSGDKKRKRHSKKKKQLS